MLKDLCNYSIVFRNTSSITYIISVVNYYANSRFDFSVKKMDKRFLELDKSLNTAKQRLSNCRWNDILSKYETRHAKNSIGAYKKLIFTVFLEENDAWGFASQRDILKINIVEINTNQCMFWFK